jgi:phytoene/squalene synthetase
MNEDLREVIEIAKLLEDWDLGEPADDVRGAIKLLITTAEQVLEAGENLPYQNTGNPVRDSEHNSVVDDCQPILAKKNLRIAELEDLLDSLYQDISDGTFDKNENRKEYLELIGKALKEDK